MPLRGAAEERKPLPNNGQQLANVGWITTVRRMLDYWLPAKAKLVKNRVQESPDNACNLHPVIQEFQQIPLKPPYNTDAAGKPQVRDYITMLHLFNMIISSGAPEFEDNYLVGAPINAILDWPMRTSAGRAVFLNPKVNVMFHSMFAVWAEYLASPASRSVLTRDHNGWFGPAATKAMPNFEETFVCDPNAPYHGFKSWDDFFTRRFRSGARPVELPDDDSIINSACECTIYNIANNIKKHDRFWLKAERYSLVHMLDSDPFTEQFAGGSIWQGYLSTLAHHRWASLVRGVIVKTAIIPGAYCAISPAMGFVNEEVPSGTESYFQTFLTSIAARAIIFIQATNPTIGLTCFIAVGMCEVSSCEVTVKPGDAVKKGDELGMFHYGGSTHCLLFRPEANIQFPSKFPVGASVKLNSSIATLGDEAISTTWTKIEPKGEVNEKGHTID